MFTKLIAEATEVNFYRSFDALVTDERKEDYSFTLLEATYRERTGLRFEPSDYVSFGLTDKNGYLTNAGRLLADQHIVYNSRVFCTRWNGLEKGSIFDDALDDKEFEGNLIYLLQNGSDFIRNNSKVRFAKKAQYRVDKPDYADRAVTEALHRARQRDPHRHVRRPAGDPVAGRHVRGQADPGLQHQHGRLRAPQSGHCRPVPPHEIHGAPRQRSAQDRQRDGKAPRLYRGAAPGISFLWHRFSRRAEKCELQLGHW